MNKNMIDVINGDPRDTIAKAIAQYSPERMQSAMDVAHHLLRFIPRYNGLYEVTKLEECIPATNIGYDSSSFLGIAHAIKLSLLLSEIQRINCRPQSHPEIALGFLKTVNGNNPSNIQNSEIKAVDVPDDWRKGLCEGFDNCASEVVGYIAQHADDRCLVGCFIGTLELLGKLPPDIAPAHVLDMITSSLTQARITRNREYAMRELLLHNIPDLGKAF